MATAGPGSQIGVNRNLPIHQPVLDHFINACYCRSFRIFKGKRQRAFHTGKICLGNFNRRLVIACNGVRLPFNQYLFKQSFFRMDICQLWCIHYQRIIYEPGGFIAGIKSSTQAVYFANDGWMVYYYFTGGENIRNFSRLLGSV